jgi:hypothetical protein
VVTLPDCCGSDLEAEYNTGSNELQVPNLMPDLATRVAFNPAKALHVDVGAVLRVFRHTVTLGAIPGIALAIVIAVIEFLGWVAAAFGGARPRRPRQGLPRHHQVSERTSDPWPRPGRIARRRPRAACRRPAVETGVFWTKI